MGSTASLNRREQLCGQSLYDLHSMAARASFYPTNNPGDSMEACVGPTSAAFLKWLAPIIASFFPWPALIALLLLLSPFRRSLSSFVSGFAELPRAVTAIQLAGMKINLDPSKAKELLSISSEVVFSDFDRM